MKKLSLATKHRALGFQNDDWSCGFQSLNIAKVVVEHRGCFSDVPLVSIGTVSWIMRSALLMLIVLWGSLKRPVTIWRARPSFLALLSPPPPPGTQVESAFPATEESVHTTPAPLECKEASAEQSLESPEARTQSSMATPTEEDDRPKVLIRGEWRKVPHDYTRDASGQLERD